MKVCVIGLGEIGFATFQKIVEKYPDTCGVDVNKEWVDRLRKLAYNTVVEIPKSDIYIICVYSTEQVMNVIEKIDKSNHPLIIIESTIIPGTYKKLLNDKIDLVIFPHRYNPKDSKHHIFNLDRIIGGSRRALPRALEFYKPLIQYNLIHPTTGELAELCKPLENALRYIEIATAEEIRSLCEKEKIDFNEVRNLCNTKWNIDIKEARDGIGGKCLPKDMKIINDFFVNNKIFSTCLQIDDEYRKRILK